MTSEHAGDESGSAAERGLDSVFGGRTTAPDAPAASPPSAPTAAAPAPRTPDVDAALVALREDIDGARDGDDVNWDVLLDRFDVVGAHVRLIEIKLRSMQAQLRSMTQLLTQISEAQSAGSRAADTPVTQTPVNQTPVTQTEVAPPVAEPEDETGNGSRTSTTSSTTVSDSIVQTSQIAQNATDLDSSPTLRRVWRPDHS